MRLLTMLAVLVTVGLAAFSLAMSGLGAVGNFVVFAAASVGFLFVTVNLTSAKRRAEADSARGDPPAAPGAEA